MIPVAYDTDSWLRHEVLVRFLLQDKCLVELQIFALK